MNIISNPYAGYSQAKNQIFQYDTALQQQQKPAQEAAANRYQDRVTLSGAGGNLLDFFLAGDELHSGTTPEQELKRSAAELKNHLLGIFEQHGIADDNRISLKKTDTGFVVELQAEGGISLDKMEQLSESLNNNAEFKQSFSATEQVKRLSVAIAKAKMRMESLAKDGVVPQYQELQKIKQQIEQLFMSVSFSAGELAFELVE